VDDENRKLAQSLGNQEEESVESVMMDSKRAMRKHNLALGCNYHHQLGFTGVLEPWQDNSEGV
jgi:hypothetical protein